MKPGPSF